MADSFNVAMGKVIRKHRHIHGLTMKQLGSQLGVSYQQIGKYENGSNGCSAETVGTLAEIFSLTVAQMYEEAGVAAKGAKPSPAENDSFLAARYVGKIEDPKIRSIIIDVARKAAYRGEAA